MNSAYTKIGPIKLARSVLRGGSSGDVTSLPDHAPRRLSQRQPLSDWLALVERASEPGLLTAFIYRVFQAFGVNLKKTTPSQGCPHATLGALKHSPSSH